MTVKAKKKNASPSSGGKAGKKSAGLFNFFRISLVYLLAFYGLHCILRDNVQSYRSFTQKQYKNIQQGKVTVSESLAPNPTITIKNTADLAKTPYDNLALGAPGYNCDVIIDRMGYALGYSEKYEQPLWVTYKLTADEVKSKKAKRSGDFRIDEYIPTGSATPDDYKKSYFDRGHLAPAADMSFSLQAMSESFYMSNMSPQRPEFNRGIWKDLEEKVRDIAVACGSVYVVTGPVFEPHLPCITIGRNKVAVPDKYYKIIFDANAKNPKAIGFIIPNSNVKEDLANFAVSVDAVEEASGLDFFPALNKADEMKIESSCDYSAWERLLPKKSKKKNTSSKRSKK
ncbi:MAG: DNA/RNA non-specific endonuclease [Lentisphaerae bacterium]|nr:DNA/RNA non-specific endonuclease [Lentisphaerota bacterium]